jgi:adenosylcobinamide-GDP ribazoletransferase
MNKFLSVFSLVSRIPVPIKFKSKFKFDASRIDFYLPVVGVFASIITLASAELFYCLSHNRLLAVLCALAAQYFCFNLFHLDGLIDTADAFLGTVDGDKTQRILKDSRMGTYGFFAGALSLAIKAALVYILFGAEWPGGGAGRYLFFIWPVAGRFAASIIPSVSLPAKKDGLGSLAKGASLGRSIAGCLVSCLVLFIGIYLFEYFITNTFSNFDFFMYAAFAALFIIILFIAAFITALFYSSVYKKRLGGYTGDALGAATESGEILFLLLLLVFIRFFGDAIGIVLC